MPPPHGDLRAAAPRILPRTRSCRCSSARPSRTHGVRRLLKALRHEAPGVAVTAARRGIKPEGEAVAQVFKTTTPRASGKLSLCARLARRDRGGRDGRTARASAGCCRSLGATQAKLAKAGAGEVVALGAHGSGQDRRDADPVGQAGGGRRAFAAAAAAGLLAWRSQAENRNDDVKLSGALHKLIEEDPSLRLRAERGDARAGAAGPGRDPPADRARSAQVQVQRAGEGGEAAGAVQGDDPPRRRPARPLQAPDAAATASSATCISTSSRCRAARASRSSDKVVGGAVPRQFIPAVEEGAREFMVKGIARLPGGRCLGDADRRPVSRGRLLRHGVQAGGARGA